jgi:hypothetical protein
MTCASTRPPVPNHDADPKLGQEADWLSGGWSAPDGSIPSRDEQKALKEVSESIARGIRTVIKREAREQQVAELIADNARRIEALEALLGGGTSAAGRQRPRSV